jgi:hypothetical protein
VLDFLRRISAPAGSASAWRRHGRAVGPAGADPTPAGTATDRAVAPFVVRPRAWASSEPAGRRPCSLGSVVSPQSELVAPPGRCRPPGHAAGRSRPSPGRSSEPSPSCHQVWSLYPGMGPLRTLNWTLNAESRPQRERRAARLRAQNPAISRRNREVARPGIEPGTPRFSGSRNRRIEAPETA